MISVFALVAVAAPAAAEPAFGWRAPTSCPRADEVRARIERRLGGPIDGVVHGIEIEITRDGTGYVAQIDARALTVANDVRTLRSAKCAELADAIAVIVARLATEARKAEPTRGTPSTEPQMLDAAPTVVSVVDEPGPAEEQETRVVRTVSSTAVAHRRWGGGVRALALSGIGALPRINIGGEIAGYVRREDYFAEVGLARWVPQSARFDPGAPARVDVSLDVIALRAGWGPEYLPIRAWLLTEVGRMQGEGVEVLEPRVGTSRWIALGGGFGVAWPMAPHARLVGTFEVAVPLQRTTFMLQKGADLYEPSVVVARCALGLELGWR